MKKLLLLCFLSISILTHSQNTFKRIYNVPSTTINCMARFTVGGKLAVGTDSGLIVYVDNKSYVVTNDTPGFTTNIINDVMWFNSSLWVATDDGVFELSSSDYSIKNHYNKSNSTIPSNFITCLGNVYFMGEPTILGGTVGQGIAILDLTNGWWGDAIGVGSDENTINDMVTLFGQLIVTATNGGMIIGEEVWGPWELSNKSNSPIGADKINSITKEGNSDLWLCHDEGVTWYDGFDVKIYDSLSAELSTNKIQSAAYLDGDLMCFGAVNGDFILFNVNDEKATKYYNNSNSNLPKCTIYQLETDYQGNVWIATDKGLYLYNESGFPASTNNVNKVEINIYPNPVSGDLLNIDLPASTSLLVVEIVDVTGKLVTSGNGNKMDVSELQSGIYFIRVTTSSGATTQKIIKQ